MVQIADLLARRGVLVPYRTLHRFCVERCGFGRDARSTVRVADGQPGWSVRSTSPGWGWSMTRARGRRRTAHALIFTAVDSRHMFVWLTFSQTHSSHNPTLTRNVALDAWHSGGLQAIDIEDPGHPTQAGWFSPTPLATVALEDPALSRGPNKVVMWSFPIVRDGLIYVVDIRNGLYVLDYNGSHADEVHELRFLEGNSNLGDAVRIDKSGRN